MISRASGVEEYFKQVKSNIPRFGDVATSGTF
jgi:hypothetical protein